MGITNNLRGFAMQDPLSMLMSIRRPRLLIRAARAGAQDYDRGRHLPRLIGYGKLPGPAASILRLIEIERDHDHRRRADEAGYSLTRHLDVLIALMGEAQLLRAAHPGTGGGEARST